MKKTIILLAAFAWMQGGYAQQDDKTNNNQIEKDTIMEQQYGVPEMYDFEGTENGTKWVEEERNGWIAEKWENKNGGFYLEYAPSLEFHVIVKAFWSNGMIRERIKLLGSVSWGVEERFDEQGNLINLIDEDKKFGKIKPQDIVEFLEKEGWFDRKTGENKLSWEKVLPTTGRFYREIIRYVNIYFRHKEDGRPYWVIEVEPKMMEHVTTYIIDGDTGEFTKEEKYVPRIE